jgi:hypothetical protein
MVTYSSGTTFQAKMAAKLAALNNETPPSETVALELGPLELKPAGSLVSTSIDTDPSTWSLTEKSAALAFWDLWNVNGKIECDCSDVLCRRAQALNAAIVPF